MLSKSPFELSEAAANDNLPLDLKVLLRLKNRVKPAQRAAIEKQIQELGRLWLARCLGEN